MPSKNKQPQIPLPKSWGTHVKTAIIHVVALAQYALTYSRSWAADSTNQRVRLKVENDQLEQELVFPSSEFACPNRVVASPIRSTQMGHINSLDGDTGCTSNHSFGAR